MTSDEVAVAALEALNALGLSYMVTGSFARNMYAIPRSTKDIDFVIETAQFSPADVAKKLGMEFRLDPQVYFETITGTTRFIIRHQSTGFAVEFFLLSDDEHDRERFRRRVSVTIQGKPTFIPTAEDVIIAKLRWSQCGRRSKDREDAKLIMAVQAGKLDWQYIHEWCRKHGTLELLQEIQAEFNRLIE